MLISKGELLFVALIMVATAVRAQTFCSKEGKDAQYFETVDVNMRHISTSGCPNTPTMSGNEAGKQALGMGLRVPTYPRLNSAVTSLAIEGGAIGVAYDGVAFYSCYAGSEHGPCAAWSSDAVQHEGNTINCVGGQAAGSAEGYTYHYHVPPTALLDSLGQAATEQGTTTAHSPQLGWALDGFPVYGPNGEGGTIMALCGSTAADSSNCLDDCNGQQKVLAGVDGYKYRYYITGLISDGTTMPYSTTAGNVATTGQDYFPHTMLCFRGCCPAGQSCSFAALPTCSGTEAEGTTEAFVPSAHNGCASQYGTGCCTSGGYQPPSASCSARAAHMTLRMSGSLSEGSGSCAYTSWITPSPTPILPTSTPTATPTPETVISQSVSFPLLSPSDYVGDTKETYEVAYAMSIGVFGPWNLDLSGKYLKGASVTSHMASRRDSGTTVAFTAHIPQTEAGTVSAAQKNAASPNFGNAFVSAFGQASASQSLTSVSAPVASGIVAGSPTSCQGSLCNSVLAPSSWSSPIHRDALWGVTAALLFLCIGLVGLIYTVELLDKAKAEKSDKPLSLDQSSHTETAAGVKPTGQAV